MGLFVNIDYQELAKNLAPYIIAELKAAPAPEPEIIDEEISFPKALKIIQVTRPTLSAWEQKGYIESHRIGGKKYFFKAELLKCAKLRGKM